MAVNLAYHVGSKDDGHETAGLAHLVEHLFFQGSAHLARGEHMRHVQRVGGVANGSTWFDRTSYFNVLPARHLDLGLWLESDRMGYLLPSLSAEALDTQRKVVMNERIQRVDNLPYGRAVETVYEMLYPAGHPYRMPVIGVPEQLLNIDLDAVREFLRSFYTPANAALALIGAFDVDVALESVKRYFGELPGGDSATRPRMDPVRRVDDKRRRLVDSVRLPRLYKAFHVPRVGHDDQYAAELLGHVLASGKSSLLQRDLVHQSQLAVEVRARVAAAEDGSSLWLMATAAEGTDLEAIEGSIEERLGRLTTTPVSPQDLERARHRVLNHRYHEFQLLSERVERLSRSMIYFGAPEAVAKETNRFESLTAERLQEFCRRYLVHGGHATLSVVPEQTTAGP